MSGRLTSAEQALIDAAEAWLDDCVDEDDLPEIMVIATCDALVAAVRALRLEREDNREDTYKALEEEWPSDDSGHFYRERTNDWAGWSWSVEIHPGDDWLCFTAAMADEASCVRLARSLSSLLENN